MKKKEEALYRRMAQTAEQVGINVRSDEHCAKLLAWLYAYGGSSEAVVFNVKLNTDIQLAQQRFNLSGGQRPDPNKISILRKYLKEVDPILRRIHHNHPSWVAEIQKIYGIHGSNYD